MNVYTGTRMKNWPYRRKLVPSIGHRFPAPMGSEAPVLQQNLVSPSMPVNLVRVALLIAVGTAAWKIYDTMRERRIMANLPPFPGIGSAFNVGAAIGPAYHLGPYIL